MLGCATYVGASYARFFNYTITKPVACARIVVEAGSHRAKRTIFVQCENPVNYTVVYVFASSVGLAAPPGYVFYSDLRCLKDETVGSSGTMDLSDDNADCKAQCDDIEDCVGFTAHTSNGLCWPKGVGCYDDLHTVEQEGVVTYGTYIKEGRFKQQLVLKSLFSSFERRTHGFTKHFLWKTCGKWLSFSTRFFDFVVFIQASFFFSFQIMYLALVNMLSLANPQKQVNFTSLFSAECHGIWMKMKTILNGLYFFYSLRDSLWRLCLVQGAEMPSRRNSWCKWNSQLGRWQCWLQGTMWQHWRLWRIHCSHQQWQVLDETNWLLWRSSGTGYSWRCHLWHIHQDGWGEKKSLLPNCFFVVVFFSTQV